MPLSEFDQEELTKLLGSSWYFEESGNMSVLRRSTNSDADLHLTLAFWKDSNWALLCYAPASPEIQVSFCCNRIRIVGPKSRRAVCFMETRLPEDLVRLTLFVFPDGRIHRVSCTVGTDKTLNELIRE